MSFRFDWDGHVHSGFCPHGSGHPTRDYVERAIRLGFRRVSILEHYPLPPDFPWPETARPVCFGPGMVERYLDETLALRREFADRIEVLVGFEWDFLPGWERWTRSELDRVGLRVQDGLLSVHFVKGGIVDEAAEFFTRDVLPRVGGALEAAYEAYYDVLLDAVRSDLGEFKPRRLGHINLIRKFQVAIPAPGEYRERILAIVEEASAKGMQLDFNMSGLRQSRCGEPYLPEWLIERVKSGEPEIECVFGSDAHSPDEVGWGLEEAEGIVSRV